MNTANPSDTPRVCEICFKQYVPVGWAQRRCKECGTKYDHEHRRVREQNGTQRGSAAREHTHQMQSGD
jgi:tRNA(Ile2) C34 agmatinyltransferase TiaS